MAFNGCTKLTLFTQNGEPQIEYIGEYAFGYTYALREANFPAVTDLGNWAFAYSRMESVSMPELKILGADRYSAVQKLDGITDFRVINPTTGAEIIPEAGVYTIAAENATLQYRIDSANLLRYDVKLSGLESGIAQPEINEQRADEYYTPAGQRIAHPHYGIYIHRPADGTPARLIMQH